MQQIYNFGRLIGSKHNVRHVVAMCEKYISRRDYWLHNKVGGKGWTVFPGQRTVKIDDPEMFTWMILRLS